MSLSVFLCKMKFFVVVILLSCSYNTVVAFDRQCGVLNVDQVYNESQIAEFSEYPWVARVLYESDLEDKLQFYCNAVLIGKAHLLATAQCFTRKDIRAKKVLLGDSNYGNKDDEPDCNTKGVCAPPPKLYDIQDIAMHPNFNPRKYVHNIAIIHLTENVEFSDYIQPICLPPSSKYSNNIIGQYLPYVGFVAGAKNNRTEKLKSVAHVMSLEDCSRKFQRQIPDTNFCGTYVGDLSFLAGSALMDVFIKDGKLQNYYLIGLAVYSSKSRTIIIDVFVKIATHINWIQNNIKHNLRPQLASRHTLSNVTTSELEGIDVTTIRMADEDLTHNQMEKLNNDKLEKKLKEIFNSK